MALFVIFIAGCGNSSNGVVGRKVGFGQVMEFKTSGGVSCVFVKSGNGGGLSCNWNEFNVNVDNIVN